MLENRSVARRIGVLDSLEPVSDAGAVSIRALAPEARFVLRLPFADAQRISTVAGMRIDVPINRTSSAGGRTAARLGPDEWLLIVPEADAEAAQGELTKTLGEVHHALVDISHRNVGVLITGGAAAAVINTGCPLDLGGGKFPVGAVSRTLFGKAEVVLFRLADAPDALGASMPVYRMECWRSFGRYVAALLVESVNAI